MFETVDIEGNLKQYLSDEEGQIGLKPHYRYVSFDYCFNYFQAFRENNTLEALVANENIQMSCFQLAFYLASWGMYRGSSFLLQHSAKFLEPIIDFIAETDQSIWEIDANNYSDENIEKLLNYKKEMTAKFRPYSASETLVSKIMLGVFGNVPAFDSNFRYGFGVSTFGPKALHQIADFYHEYSEIIERYRVNTIDFETGEYSERQYTRAKVIDMIFFIEGM